MFRRPRFIPIRRTIVPALPPALRHAQQLMISGKYQEAGEAFEQLAQGAQVRGFPQDAHLFLTAGHCRLMAKQIDPAMNDMKQGLSILAAREKEVRLAQAGQRCIAQLTEQGYPTEAEEIKKLLKATLPAETITRPPQQAGPPRSLPATCPACGGSLRSDEVDWIDETSAECAWCGSTVKTL